jgi:hypothetical protein
LLADEINRSPDIQMLNFTGGEPTLFLPQIQQLLGRIRRKIPLVMTTNGWFADRSIRYLDELPLTAVVISHDRFHAPFISLEKILPLISHFQSRNIDVSFNFVYADIHELADLAPVQALGITVHTSRLIKSGRAQEGSAWHDSRAIHQTCPSLDASQRRTPDLEKVIYTSQKGYSPCCGPLVFDEQVNSDYAYTETLSRYSSNRLLKDLSSGSFAQQAQSLGLDLSQFAFQNPCDPCALLHGKIAPELPSIAEISRKSDDTIYLPFEGAIEIQKERLLLQKYIVGYTELLDPKKLEAHLKQNSEAASDVVASPLTPNDQSAVIEFVRTNYYEIYKEFYPQASIDEFVRFAPVYLSWPSMQGFVYRKNERIVGTIFTNKYDPHPALKVSTLHIGYWGYDREIITQVEARWIKRHWLQALYDWSEGSRAIDASFDSFNPSALRLARSLGFERRMLRLNKKAV